MKGVFEKWMTKGLAAVAAVAFVAGCTMVNKDSTLANRPDRQAAVTDSGSAPPSGPAKGAGAAGNEQKTDRPVAINRPETAVIAGQECAEPGELLSEGPEDEAQTRYYKDVREVPAVQSAPAGYPPAPDRDKAHRAERSRAVVEMGDGVGGYTSAPGPAQTLLAAPADVVAPYYQDFGRDRFEHREINPVKVAAEDPVSTFSVDVDTASYAFVRKSINAGHLPPKDSVRVEEMINYFDYSYKTPCSWKVPFEPNVAVYPTPWNPDTLLLHIGIKGLTPQRGRNPRANLVFLIDVSGSMNAPDKLPLVQNSMRLLLDSLGPDDTVGIVVYAGAAGTVLEPTRAGDRRKILTAIERLRAGGSTAGAEGIRQAYALAKANYDVDAVNRVILATDGDFNVGITNIEELKGFVERERENGIFLSVLGFGTGNYNDALMQALAQNGNGNAAYIDTLNEARKVLVDEAASTLFPIAKDVKIQVEFNPERVAEYRLIGYETRMLRREDFNNDKVDAGDVGCGHAVTAIYEITPNGSPARLMDELRYMGTPAAKSGKKREYAFLKIRYKLPREDESRLMVTPITDRQAYARVEDAPDDMRFAAAVAAFGQLLRGGEHTRDFSYCDVLELAGDARGDDPSGYRAEFVGMVRAAKNSPSMASMR